MSRERRGIGPSHDGADQREAGVAIRGLRALRDGSLAFKLLNRLSRVHYVPSPEVAVDRFLAEHYPEGLWKNLSPEARRVWLQFAPVFEECQIRNIAYVGAHIGATALLLDEAFPGREFLLLEPAPAVFEMLVSNVGARPNMRCVNAAAGEEEDELEMLVDDGYPAANSLLPYEPIALKEFPVLGTRQTRVRVRVTPLDDLVVGWGTGAVDMLVMDVQGYEDAVLRGASRVLQACRVVMSELNLVPLYAGSSTFASVYEALVTRGFTLRYLLKPLTGRSQRVLQVDGLFVRERQ
ncbi:MAG: FkbM family methyltransferase [bacterium]